MWYFSWLLGVLLAVSLGIINVMWYEMEQHVDNVAKDQGAGDAKSADGSLLADGTRPADNA